MLAPPPIEMANIGMADTLILMVLALVVFGPRRLPQIGRQIGKLMYEFRKASNDFKFQMEEELRQAEEADRRKKEEERRKAQATVPQAASQPIATAESTMSSAVSASDPYATQPVSPVAGTYPVESVYPYAAAPDAAAGTAQPIDATAAAVEAARLRIEPSIEPRIQPPSTGEVVAANRPGAATNAPESAGEAALISAAAEKAANGGASPAKDAEGSEPAAHHG